MHIEIKVNIMLSIITSKNTTAKSMKEALSFANGNPINNRNTIRQATARASGFNSVEHAKAMLDRNKMIDESLWMERNPIMENVWQIIAGKVIITIADDKLTVQPDGYRSESIEMPIPNFSFRWLTITEEDIEYCNEMKKIVIKSPKNRNDVIVVQRIPDNNSVRVACYSIGEELKNYVPEKNAEYDLGDYNASMDRFRNSEIQMARLLSEYIAASDVPLENFSEKLGLTGIEIEQIEDTAQWLFELEKGNILEAKEIEPKVKFKQGIGMLAYIALSKVVCYQSVIQKDMCASMDINLFELNELRNIAKNEYDLFNLFYV
jgi:hypothetical protein